LENVNSKLYFHLRKAFEYKNKIMRLSEEEYYQFYDLHPLLLYYIGSQKHMIPPNTTLEDFMMLSVQEKYPIREALYENINVIDDFIRDFGKEFSKEEIEIIQGFKNFKKGSFYVMQLTKKHALFLGDEFVYAVLALGDPFEYFWGNQLPVMVETVLLPFKGKIIYDGIIATNPIHFGRGIGNSLKNELNLKKGQYGLITKLPIDNEIKNRKVSLKETLLILMKTKASREQNYYEIEELLEKNPNLYPTYYKEWGRINSRGKKKELKEIGIKKHHFAIYIDTILCSAKTLKEVEETVKNMVNDKDALNSIHYFKV